jgi:hypothetical protein
MKKYLQKLPFWPSGGKPGPAATVPEQRPNDPEEDARELRREALAEHERKRDEGDSDTGRYVDV